MSSKFSAAADVRITLQIGSDLRVRGWSKNEIKVGGDTPHVQIDPDGQNALIQVSGDCDLSVPDHASLIIEHVGSDAKITEVYGDIKIGAVGSDLNLRDVGPVTISAIGSDARIRQVHGDVQIGSIGSDATLHEISGSVQIGSIGSDAYLREIEGGCIVNKIGSELVLDIDFKPGHEYSFSALSDIVCRVTPGANVQFNIQAADIAIDAEDARSEASDGGQRVVFGAGEALVKLDSPTEVRIVNETDVRRIFGGGFDVSFDFDMERAFEETSRVTERARREAERATAQIQREVERAAEQFRRQAERTQRDFEKKQRSGAFGWSWGSPGRGFNPPRPPMPPNPPFAGRNAPQNATPASEPVTDSERLLILKMVESKQISVAEAERLLAALESRA